MAMAGKLYLFRNAGGKEEGDITLLAGTEERLLFSHGTELIIRHRVLRKRINIIKHNLGAFYKIWSLSTPVTSGYLRPSFDLIQFPFRF